MLSLSRLKSIFNLFIFIFFLFTSQLLYAETYYINEKAKDRLEKKYGKVTLKRISALLALMNRVEDKDEKTKLREVNNFFNQFRYISDIRLWKTKDYWATRTEFIDKFAGDCEDYSIAKYFTLKQLKIADKKLFLTYSKSLKYKTAHMVVTYFKTKRSIPLILDNYNGQILPATQRKDLKPIYSFNGQDLYNAKQKGLGEKVPYGLQKNKKWLDLLDDIKRKKR